MHEQGLSVTVNAYYRPLIRSLMRSVEWCHSATAEPLVLSIIQLDCIRVQLLGWQKAIVR